MKKKKKKKKKSDFRDKQGRVSYLACFSCKFWSLSVDLNIVLSVLSYVTSVRIFGIVRNC